MKNSLLYYLRDKLSKSSNGIFEVKLKDTETSEFYTMNISSEKKENYIAVYIKRLNAPCLFTQKFLSEELQLTETHLTLDNNKQNTHATYVFENGNKVRIYDIDQRMIGDVTLCDENPENKQILSFEDFKKIANPEFVRSIADYQRLFQSLYGELIESRNQLEKTLNALTQSFHTLLDCVEKKHCVSQNEIDQFRSIVAEMNEIVNVVVLIYAENIYDLSFYNKWNDLLNVGTLSNEFYFSEKPEWPLKIAEDKTASVTVIPSSSKKDKNKNKK